MGRVDRATSIDTFVVHAGYRVVPKQSQEKPWQRKQENEKATATIEEAITGLTTILFRAAAEARKIED